MLPPRLFETTMSTCSTIMPKVSSLGRRVSIAHYFYARAQFLGCGVDALPFSPARLTRLSIALEPKEFWLLLICKFTNSWCLEIQVREIKLHC